MDVPNQVDREKLNKFELLAEEIAYNEDISVSFSSEEAKNILIGFENYKAVLEEFAWVDWDRVRNELRKCLKED